MVDPDWTIRVSKKWQLLSEWQFSIMCCQIAEVLSDVGIALIQVGSTDIVQAKFHIEFNGMQVCAHGPGIKVGPGPRRRFPYVIFQNY